MMLCAEGIIPLSIINLPKIFLCIMTMRVEPFHATQLVDFALESSVSATNSSGLGRRGPHTPTFISRAFYPTFVVAAMLLLASEFC